MKIIIHSKGRAGLARGTVAYLSSVGFYNFVVACPADEVPKYRSFAGKRYDVHSGPKVKTLSEFQDWCVERWPDQRICMLDDDLVFAARHGGSLPKANFNDINGMFRWLDYSLTKKYQHATIDTRNGNNLNYAKHGSGREVGPARSLLAFAPGALKGIRFASVQSKGDYHVTLALLERGFPNAISHLWTHDFSRKVLVEGGCTTYRTPEFHAEASRQLQALHPQCVKIVNKNGRTDVRVQWQQAYKFSELM